MSVPPEPEVSEIGLSAEIGLSDAAPGDGTTSGDSEEVDALPVLAPVPRVLGAYRVSSHLSRGWTPTAIPAVQAAAVAAGGFVAGAAVVGLVHRRRAGAVSKGRRAGRAMSRTGRGGPAERVGELVQIVGSRSLLVDVHLLGGRD